MTHATAKVSAAPWYAVAALPPPLGVKVRVMWDARVFEAALVRHPATKALCWVTHDRSLGAVFLPLASGLRRPADPSSPWAGWHTLKGDAPDYYQPIWPDKWAVPLPEPITFREAEGRMWSARASIGHNQPPPDDDPLADDARASGQWWRDPLAIAYEPTGRVSQRMAEGRVMRAVAWCGAGRDLSLKSRTPNDVLAEMADFYEQAGGEFRDAARFHPLPQDVDDFETAMRWYVQLKDPPRDGAGRPWSLNMAQRVLLYRARPVPLSFQEIGWAVHRSAERARQVYHRAVERCHAFANGGAGPADRALEALRQRTREARRKQHV